MKEYIRELRTLVGHMPIMLAGAAVLVLDQDSRLPLLKRSDNGCWGTRGGALGPGERLEETARRET